MKAMFDIEKFHGSYVMHCPEEYMAEVFCDYLREQGREWAGGFPYKDNHNWSVYEEDTCYYFNQGQYSPLESGYIALEFEDFDWEHSEMNANTTIIDDELFNQFLFGC